MLCRCARAGRIWSATPRPGTGRIRSGRARRRSGCFAPAARLRSGGTSFGPMVSTGWTASTRVSKRRIRAGDGASITTVRGPPSSPHSAGRWRRRETSWTRTLPLEEYMVWMHSKSYVAAIAKLHGSAALEQFLTDERASLLVCVPGRADRRAFRHRALCRSSSRCTSDRERLNACASRFSEPARSARRCCPGLLRSRRARRQSSCFTEQYAARAAEISERYGVEGVSSVEAAATRGCRRARGETPRCRRRWRPRSPGSLAAETLVVSVAAGITTGSIEAHLPAGSRVVRVMPNTPMLVGEGMSVVSAGAHRRRPPTSAAPRSCSPRSARSYGCRSPSSTPSPRCRAAAPPTSSCSPRR